MGARPGSDRYSGARSNGRHGVHGVLDAGRRWGKTRLGVMECLDAANRGGVAWWVSPTYKMSEVGWRPLRKLNPSR